MDSSPKRRKTEHFSNGRPDVPVDTARMATASTFTLETDELLKEVRVDYDKTFAGAVDFLKELRGVIEGIEPHDAIPLPEATRKFEKKHKVVVPYPDPKPSKDAPYLIRYAKPSKINVVGSYVSRTMVKSQAEKAIDMVVEMPQDLFEDKDYTNMRYFYRRAYYLAYVAVGLRKGLQGDWNCKFEYLNDNFLLPVLVLRQGGNGESGEKNGGNEKNSKEESKRKRRSESFAVRVIPIAPAGRFPAAKLLPSSNCNKRGNVDQADSTSGTPFYNSTLKAESAFLQHLSLLTQAGQTCAAFTDACILGRIWLEQRAFGSRISQGGFGHFEWSAMIALLLQLGRKNSHAGLSSSLSSTELFKAAVQFLASSDLTKKPFVFGSYKPGIDTIKEPGPVLYDPAREVNLAYKMTPWSMALLQTQARSTLASLNNPSMDQFEPTFITKVDLPLQIFDSVAEVEISPGEAEADQHDGRGLVWNCSDRVYRVLKKAFGGRAQLIHIRWNGSSPWGISTSSPPRNKAKILLGITFDPTSMGRIMEHGPSKENEKEANRFHAFWGEKSELRKFREHGIIECIEWSQGSAFEICEEIARYILGFQLGISSQSLTFQHSGVSTIIELSNKDKASFDAATQAFRDFERHLRNLEGMPLQIRRLAPISPSLRYSALHTPLTAVHGGGLDPAEVILYFETSSQWPENLVAIQETKLEFLLDIGRRLSESGDSGSTALGSISSTYLGRENVDLGVDSLGYLDVVYESRFAFRLRIHSEPEEMFLEGQVRNTTLDQRVREEAGQALANFRWQYNQLPLHSQTIATFCTRLPTLSPTIRLVKRWFHSQKLATHFSEELIEMLVLHVFLHPEPWKMATSVSTGFFQFIVFLSRWEWKDEPLIVDFDTDISRSERSEMHQLLEMWRMRDVNRKQLVLFVATSHARSGLEYTRTRPSNMAAMRMTSLAKAAAEKMKHAGIHLDARTLFDTRLSDYPVIIRLSSKAIASILSDVSSEPGAQRSKFKNLDAQTGKVPLPVSRHPVDVLLQVLQETYGEVLMFFYGGPEDPTIGGVWKTGKREKFRIGLGYNFVGVKGEGEDGPGEVEVNKKAILAEIARIGGALIKRIELVGE